jgi:ABC-type sugar transport system permease subunit
MTDAFLLFIRWTHVIAAVAWVGGGIFYWVVLRPALAGDNVQSTVRRAIATEFGQLVSLCMWALVITYSWSRMGFIAIVYLAGLQGIPAELYEAARVDGAGPWTTFRRIILPLLSPVTFFVVVVSVIGTSQAFDMIAVMTDGGPGIASTTLSWYIYEQGFRAFDAGRAGASAVILFLLLLLVTALQLRYAQRRVHYQ